MGKLTEKQIQFVHNYVSNGFNATKAALAAKYSEVSAHSIGSDLLKKQEIQSYIEQYKQTLANASRVTFEWKIEALQKGIQACLDGSTNKEGFVKAESISSLVAEMNKMHGHHKPMQTENKHAVALSDDPLDLDEMLDSFESEMEDYWRDS